MSSALFRRFKNYSNLCMRWIALKQRNLRFCFTTNLGEVKPIGFMSSLFCHKRGTPRQPTICPHARGTLTLDHHLVNNPQYMLEGLEEFSHVWLIFVFHKNEKEFVRSKVSPPRLHGRKVGLFSTRSPHRPNPIGLSLAKLDCVHDRTLYLNGVDLLDGTPILDIKPYIPEYDTPQPLFDNLEKIQSERRQSCLDNQIYPENIHKNEKNQIYPENSNIHKNEKKLNPGRKTPCSTLNTKYKNKNVSRESCIEGCLCEEECENTSSKGVSVRTPDWILQPSSPKLKISFTDRAVNQLNMFSQGSHDPDFTLKFLRTSTEAMETIISILSEDPRPVHVRNQEEEAFYYFTVDTMHVTCWFYDGIAEVIRILPISRGKHLI
ncbi:tRNA (adenine(37)-N6)-methyltransferase-like [Saccostrea echinata]|uniref:tRNA (adenine(37)-N6)-methyltransferase-like n=1 Tax=Saccostrea echinata TaxID=191078 RepID=UPI002A81350A|nr:tRNA (adenine(37)-N6)-methyltransferase-like [Saccostrea echinata]